MLTAHVLRHCVSNFYHQVETPPPQNIQKFKPAKNISTYSFDIYLLFLTIFTRVIFILGSRIKEPLLTKMYDANDPTQGPYLDTGSRCFSGCPCLVMDRNVDVVPFLF